MNEKLNIKRVKLKGIGYFGHYAFVFLFLIPVIMTMFDCIQYLNGTYKGLRPIEEIINGTVPFLIAAILLFLIQYQRLRFRMVKSKLEPKRIIEICNNIAKVNKWEITNNTNSSFVAKVDGIYDWSFWGEMIIVNIERENIYVNSICDPYRRPNIISFGRNKLYIKTIINEIKNASA